MASPTDLPLAALLFLCALISAYYLWSLRKWHYWKQRGVPYLKPVLPLVGNMYDILLMRSLPDITNRIYKQTRGLPYIGIYACHTPVLFVRDLDLIARILVTDFNHFEDRGFHSNISDSLGRNLIHQSGPDWRFSRSQLSPCFTVNKVKSMLPTMKNKSEVFVETLEREMSSRNIIEMWDLCLRYTTDVVTMCTMGVDPNSLRDKKEPFREIGKHLLGFYFIFHVFVGSFFPRLHKIFNISVAKARVTQFFHAVLGQVMDHYNNNKCEKTGVVHTLMRLKEATPSSAAEKQISEIDENFVVAQAFILFLAGFETPGSVLAAALYEIAKHPHVQQRLCQEIPSVLSKHGGDVTFDALQDMKYLRQVFAEALRKYSPLTLIFRRCTKDYEIPGTSTVIEKGTLVLVPLRSIHDDPDYYPDPQAFDPDRFSDDNSAARHIAAYMPFGIGPRFCPAVLYSHIKMRTALVYLLQQYEVCLTDHTPPVIQPSPLAFLLQPKNGIPLSLRRRQ